MQSAGHGSNSEGHCTQATSGPGSKPPLKLTEEHWGSVFKAFIFERVSQKVGILHLSLTHWLWMGMKEVKNHGGGAEKFNETY